MFPIYVASRKVMGLPQSIPAPLLCLIIKQMQLVFMVDHDCSHLLCVMIRRFNRFKGVSLMLEELKNCSDPKKCFDPNVFLKSLRLDSLLPRIEVDMCFYITNRAQLEQMTIRWPPRSAEVDLAIILSAM